jgi:site-specific DNA-methyltransferase (adenine-specific)
VAGDNGGGEMKTIKLLDGTEWPVNTAYNGDCLEFMRNLPDKCIDLCLTDPPYGIGLLKTKAGNWGIGKTKPDNVLGWDNKIDPEWFTEIYRVSKHQIIWGGNNFAPYLKPSSAWISWDKLNGGSYWSDCELAYTSFGNVIGKTGARIFKCRADSSKNRHPTQKPLKLFKWCIEKYAPENALVFDPFLGSFTTAVACHHYGLDWIGCEKDEDYFSDGSHRYKMESEQAMFDFWDMS